MIHALDWILYFVILRILWFLLPEDATEELGALIGFAIVIVYTIIYCVIFYFYNWSDIFTSIPDIISW